ncbi:MAG: hypothetical protein ACLUD0_04040 [Eubacterium ramulus]
MIFLSTYRNKRRWIAAAGMTHLALMSAYVWMLDEIPGTVCVSDGQPLNITEGLPVTSQIRSTDGIAVSAGMMTGGRYEVECKLFGLIPVKEVTVHIVEETEVIPCGIPLVFILKRKVSLWWNYVIWSKMAYPWKVRPNTF